MSSPQEKMVVLVGFEPAALNPSFIMLKYRPIYSFNPYLQYIIYDLIMLL